jgi:putative tricarboxylic transport membrane protein
MTIQRSYQITGIVLLLSAVYIAYESLQLKYYSSLGPGPGFFPFWLSCLLGVLAVIMLLKVTFGKTDQMSSDLFPSRTGALRMGAVALSLIGTVICIETIGFSLTMFPMYLLLLYTFGQRRLLSNLLVAFGGSFGINYLFVRLLQVPLPRGILGF